MNGAIADVEQLASARRSRAYRNAGPVHVTWELGKKDKRSKGSSNKEAVGHLLEGRSNSLGEHREEAGKQDVAKAFVVFQKG